MGIAQAREAFIGIEDGNGSDRSFAKAKIVRVRINNDPFDMIQRACRSTEGDWDIACAVPGW
jgi:hypothetical protein